MDSDFTAAAHAARGIATAAETLAESVTAQNNPAAAAFWAAEAKAWRKIVPVCEKAAAAPPGGVRARFLAWRILRLHERTVFAGLEDDQ